MGSVDDSYHNALAGDVATGKRMQNLQIAALSDTKRCRKEYDDGKIFLTSREGKVRYSQYPPKGLLDSNNLSR